MLTNLTSIYSQFFIRFLLITDIDECVINTDVCHQNATCTNTVGSHTCSCKPGFSGNGTDCQGNEF